MKKIISAIFLSLALFCLLNLVYWNLDSATLGYPMKFKFVIPNLFFLESMPFPVGFALIVAFSLGIIAFAFLQAIPAFMKNLALRNKDKRIKELESQLKITSSSQTPTHQDESLLT